MSGGGDETLNSAHAFIETVCCSAKNYVREEITIRLKIEQKRPVLTVRSICEEQLCTISIHEEKHPFDSIFSVVGPDI